LLKKILFKILTIITGNTS